MRPALLTLLAVPVLASAQGFEGSITMQITGPDGRAMTVPYLLKGDKVRYEMAGGRGSAVTIFDAGAKKMMVVMDAQRMVIDMDMNAMADMAAMMGRGRAPAPSKAPPAITRTGRTETVAGHKCEHWEAKGEEGSVNDICVATDLRGTFRMPMAGNPMMGGGAQPAWADALGGGMALKVARDGKVFMEVTAIEPKSLDASLFEAPAGYQHMNPGAMMRGRP